MNTQALAPTREGTLVAATDVAADLPVFTLESGIVGFPELTRYVLVRLDAHGLVYDLRSLDDEHVRFVVVPSVGFFPDYAPEVDDAIASSLGLGDDQDTLVLLVVTVGATIAQSTANLMAPIVLNATSRIGAQVVLDDPDLLLRAPLSA